jgi:superfamily II DNA or RNA helicase
MLARSIATGHRRPMMQMPTGGGKTLLSASIVEGALKKGNRVTFVVPAISLIDQTYESFYAEDITTVGVIQADHALTDPSQPVQIASAQTLTKRKLPDTEIVVIDEAHVWFDLYAKWMAEKPETIFIGLSATPWAKGLGKHFDDLLIPTTIGKLIEGGFLSRFKVFAPSRPDLSKVRVRAGDYREDDLAEVMGHLVADVVSTWLEKGEGRPTLCFAVDRAHARQLATEFEAKGVGTAYVDAYTSLEERLEIRRRFHKGEVKIVCNVGTLTTGVDWDVRCIILARPTKSEMLFTQIIGRGLRRAEGKDYCLILDHSDTTLRLGYVTDIRHDKLDMGERKRPDRQRSLALPTECPKCSFVMPAKAATCAVCGFVAEAVPAIDTVDGRLVEYVPGRKRNPQPTIELRQRWFSGLLHIGDERGYKIGWAKNAYREAFGDWPSGLTFVRAAPADDIIEFVRAKARRYARERQAAADAAARSIPDNLFAEGARA